MKNCRSFSRVLEIAKQLLTRRLFYLAPWMNGNAISFLYFWNVNKICFLLWVRCSYNKQNDTWLLRGIQFLISCSTRHLTGSPGSPVRYRVESALEEKFHISARPYITLYLSEFRPRTRKGVGKLSLKWWSWQAKNHCQQSIRLENVRDWFYQLFFSAISTISHHNAPKYPRSYAHVRAI